ncbi:hypothetical protein ACW2Q0_01915 [Nocardia sp. R16R-3T]
MTAKLVAGAPRHVAGQVALALSRRGSGRVDFADLGLPDSKLAKSARHDFKQHVTQALTNEAAAVPSGRARWLIRTASFRQLIARAPFSE